MKRVQILIGKSKQEKLELIKSIVKQGAKLGYAPLCQKYGVSKQLIYSWKKRLKERGEERFFLPSKDINNIHKMFAKQPMKNREEFAQKVVEYALANNTRAAAKHFNLHHTTIFKWVLKFNKNKGFIYQKLNAFRYMNEKKHCIPKMFKNQPISKREEYAQNVVHYASRRGVSNAAREFSLQYVSVLNWVKRFKKNDGFIYKKHDATKYKSTDKVHLVKIFSKMSSEERNAFVANVVDLAQKEGVLKASFISKVHESSIYEWRRNMKAFGHFYKPKNK